MMSSEPEEQASSQKASDEASGAPATEPNDAVAPAPSREAPTQPAPRPAQPGVAAALREFFLLSESRRRVSLLRLEQQRTLRALYDGARACRDAMSELSSSSSAAPSLRLARHAAMLLLAAARVARDASTDVEAFGSARALEELAIAERAGDAPEGAVETIRALLAADALLAIEKLDSDRVSLLRSQADTALSWLAALTEHRTTSELRRVSFARLTLSTLALVGAIVWTIAAVFGPKNIALHSKVSLSTYYPGTPDPSHLVDGLRDTNVGAHTKVEDNPWILVELPGTFNVGKMRIYGRNDGYFDESLPIVLEVGEGNGPLVEVARRTEALSESNPWDVSFPVRRISKVKFTTPKHGYLALGELEVYGKPAR